MRLGKRRGKAKKNAQSPGSRRTQDPISDEEAKTERKQYVTNLHRNRKRKYGSTEELEKKESKVSALSILFGRAKIKEEETL